MLAVQLEATADSRGERWVWFHRERQLRSGDRAVELTCLRVRGSENIRRARVLSSREIGGPLCELDRLIRVAERRVGRCCEQPREAGDGGKPVRLELQGLGKGHQCLLILSQANQGLALATQDLGVIGLKVQGLVIGLHCLRIPSQGS